MDTHIRTVVYPVPVCTYGYNETFPRRYTVSSPLVPCQSQKRASRVCTPVSTAQVHRFVSLSVYSTSYEYVRTPLYFEVSLNWYIPTMYIADM